jgi:hypothetical protein
MGVGRLVADSIGKGSGVFREIDTEGGKVVTIDILTSRDKSQNIVAILGLIREIEGVETELVLMVRLGGKGINLEDVLDIEVVALLGLSTLFNVRGYDAGFLKLVPLSTYLDIADKYECQRGVMRLDVGVLMVEQKDLALRHFKDKYKEDIAGFNVDGVSSLGDIMDRLRVDVKGNKGGSEVVEGMWLGALTGGMLHKTKGV